MILDSTIAIYFFGKELCFNHLSPKLGLLSNMENKVWNREVNYICSKVNFVSLIKQVSGVSFFSLEIKA